MTNELIKLAQKYGIEQYLEYNMEKVFVEHWEGNNREKMGCRKLAHLSNKLMIKSACQDARAAMPDCQLDKFYNGLNSDIPSRRQYYKKELERKGIDVEELVDDFVSPSTVYMCLTEEFGAEKDIGLRKDTLDSTDVKSEESGDGEEGPPTDGTSIEVEINLGEIPGVQQVMRRI